MTVAELADRVLSVVRATPGDSSFPWIEVRVLASFATPRELEAAPHSFAIRDAVWGLVEDGRLVLAAGKWVRLPEA